MQSSTILLLESQIKQVEQTIKDLRYNIVNTSFAESYIEQYDELLQTKTLLVTELNQLKNKK